MIAPAPPCSSRVGWRQRAPGQSLSWTVPFSFFALPWGRGPKVLGSGDVVLLYLFHFGGLPPSCAFTFIVLSRACLSGPLLFFLFLSPFVGPLSRPPNPALPPWVGLSWVFVASLDPRGFGHAGF